MPPPMPDAPAVEPPSDAPATGDGRALRVFVSSRMAELRPERRAVGTALEADGVAAWIFEDDAGARPESIETTFVSELEAADLYLGVFWNGYGAYTLDEYEVAQQVGLDCLLYEKRVDVEARDPRLQRFLDRVGDVEDGHTIRWFETADELGRMVREDVARWRAQRRRAAAAAGPRPRTLAALAERVRKLWVEDVLEPVLATHTTLDLDKTVDPDAVRHPAERVLARAGGEAATIPATRRMVHVYRDLGRSLLLLGGPGSGKTVTLLHLARDLLGRSRKDPAAAVPIVLNLSTWAEARKPLAAWAAAEIEALYYLRPDGLEAWLREGRAVLLLDGLDEVEPDARAACVAAIDAYVQAFGFPSLVVSCRTEAYDALPEKLTLYGAVRLEPLRSEQVMADVARGGAALAALHAALASDRVLRTLARTPLMLSIMKVAYRDLPLDALRSDALDTPEERRAHVFETYAERMFEHQKAAFGADVMRPALAWLARQMQAHGLSIFQLKKLQPSWLPSARLRAVYALATRTLGGLVLGLVLGLFLGLVFAAVFGSLRDVGAAFEFGAGVGTLAGLVRGGVDAWRLARRAEGEAADRRRIQRDLVLAGLSVAAILAVVVAVSGGVGGLPFLLPVGLVLGVVLGLKDRTATARSDIQTVELLRWSGAGAQRYGALGGAAGLAAGAALGAALAAGSGALGAALAAFGGVGLFLGAVLGVVFGGLRGLSGDEAARPNRVPRSGLRLALRNVGLAGLAVGAATAAATGLPAALWQGAGVGAAVGGLLGLLFGLVAALWYGGFDVLEHYVLRALLRACGRLPRFRYTRVLDAGVRLIFLRRVGTGYLFIHRYLQEHFAAQAPPAPDAC